MTKPARDPGAVEEIRDGIIEKAVNILAEEGFASLTMRRIASVTRMSATNLYNYFANKDEIYISILIKGFEKLYGIFLDVSRSTAEPRERGKRLMKAYLEFGIGNSHYYDIMFTRPAPRYNEYKGTPLEAMAQVEMDYSVKIIQITADAVRDVLTQDGIAPDGEVLGRRLLQAWALVHGLIVLHNSRIVTYVSEDARSLYEKAIDEVLDLMGGDGSTA